MAISSGYSGTPLVKKLGIKAGMRVYFLNAPAAYAQVLGKLPLEVNRAKRLAKAHSLDFIQFFALRTKHLQEKFVELKTALTYEGILWICWPKRASRVDTDLDENVVRRLGLQAGLVDVKVAAVDEVWSGLKFVYRLEDRPGR